MTEGIERVTLEKAAEHLKDKIRTAFVELLPEEQWKEMVSKWQGKWSIDGQSQISEAINSWLTANSKALIESTVQALAGRAAQNLIQGIR
jgi:hypothetical protein